ncbi:OB-fold domain-containing protein [[Mycobacterium] burgundiense]|uniref:OB-fold domain-containing protein n=1 Tax=[Mycobacterium] burgundiense TaxID=3064286 RepID=A0ABM9LK69_9MYCO|nr:OB-fold domain-containing protein [Mycolicibacterium sp. MU0053]CAJ1500394.1 OB-fold domain-containing protein [Mycolicibacterium sp. MU0053]
MSALVGYGTYLPYWRLDAASIREVLGSSGGKGTRAVAAYDEDATTMGVEAARDALAHAPEGFVPEALYFVTTSPAYVDKTNAAAIHAALGLPQHVPAYDFGGATRSISGVMDLVQASSLPALVVASELRTGLPGSADEATGGDGAACFLFGESNEALVEVLASASATEEFLDRWRVPGQDASRLWEDRFGESAYQPLGRAAFTDALKKAGLSVADVDHLVVTGLHTRAVRAFTKWSGVRPEARSDDLVPRIGNTGSAAPGISLAHILDTAEPGAVIVSVALADGADVVVMRATEQAVSARAQHRRTVRQLIDGEHGQLNYGSFLTWRGRLDREPPRRPNPPSPAAGPSLRRRDWKFGLTASRCENCDTRHLPAARVCVQCRTSDRMLAERVAEERATVATYTVDRLAFSPSPPLIAAMIDFDGGGRAGVEITDAGPDDIAIGTRLEMTFRRLYTAENGVHNYFWKARPIREAGE